MTIKLIDLYSGNDFKPDKLIADGFTGVIFKGGQGGWADCPRYHSEWWKQAKDAGLLVGWYWLCDSRYHSTAHVREMNAWKIFDDVGQLGLWIDVEKPMIGMTEKEYWLTPYAGYKNVVDLVYLVNGDGKGVDVGIYTGPGAYELIMRGAPITAHDYLGAHKLWTAQYPWVYVPGISKPKLYGSWFTWEFWQYQEGPDINIYNGTNEEFFAKYGGQVNPIPPEPPIVTPPIGGTMYKGIAKQAPVNVKPMDGSSPLAQLQLGWYVYGDYSTTRSDIINVTAYYKGNEGAKISLSKPCKVIASALTITEVPITPPVIPPDADDYYVRAVLIKPDGTSDEYTMMRV
jgi:hypothetical protein